MNFPMEQNISLENNSEYFKKDPGYAFYYFVPLLTSFASGENVMVISSVVSGGLRVPFGEFTCDPISKHCQATVDLHT